MAASPSISLNINPNKDFLEKAWRIPDLIRLKRDGNELTSKQVSFLVNAITDGSMEDAQLGAFLMSVYLKGMTKEETSALTYSMKHSGSIFSWPSTWRVVDKHSTGGVGDKVSLALAPALASHGLKVPMISGRGLAHTGGTLDKLESIPGFKVTLSEDEMHTALETVGCCIVGQTKSLVPADRRMYAARDVTATVPSIPLIVSSIISKKACENLESLVLDVKFGSGAFAKTQFEAEALAESLVSAGDALGINTTALVTSMDLPLGKHIGNALEVEEAIQCMRGKGPKDLRELVGRLGGELLLSSGIAPSHEEGTRLIEQSLDDESALNTFSRMIQFQGVSPTVAQKLCGETMDVSVLPQSAESTKIIATKSGRIIGINALIVADVCLHLGAGRATSSDSINYAVGMLLLKVVGDLVEKGQPWAELRHDGPLKDTLFEKINSSIVIGDAKEKNKNTSVVFNRISKSNAFIKHKV